MTADRILGVDAGGTAIKYVLTEQDGTEVHSGEVATDPGDVGRSLRRLARRAAAELGDGGLDRLAGVGMACAGIVDPVSGWLGNSPNLPGWARTDLKRALATAFGDTPGAVANDVNAALYGEYRRGAGRGCRDLVMLALGTGVGGGVMCGGHLILGAHCGAGEIGHMVLDPDGPACACGGRGCLEAWAGSIALLREARAAVASGNAGPDLTRLVTSKGDELAPVHLAAAAEGGDATSSRIFETAGRRLGQAIGNLINLLDPERVIIGGGVARAGELILAPCRDEAPRLVLAEKARSTPIVMAELGGMAAAIGAAGLIRETVRDG